MKKRNWIIIGLVLLLGVAALVVYLVMSPNHTNDNDFHIEAAAQPGAVSRIFMADKENHQMLLTYQSDSLWLVDNKYPANQPKIDMLLETLAEMRVRNNVNRAAVENVTSMIAAKSVKVEVYYDDYRINLFKGKIRFWRHEKCRVFYVGHDTLDMMSTYMYAEGDELPRVIYIPGFRGCLSPRFVVDPLAWRSHSIVDLPVQRIAKVELTIPSMPSESFAVVREGEGFVFNLLNPPMRVNGFDTARVAQLLSSFVNLNFDEFARAVPKVVLDTTFSQQPRTILRVTDVDGNVNEVKTYIKYTNPDDIYNMPDTTMYDVFDINRLYAVVDSKDTVLIQYYIFDNILQPASFFLGREKSVFAR